MQRKGDRAAVIDASVLAKWFVEEDHSDIALKLRDDYVSLKLKVVVPQIAAYEVLNALKYSHSFGTKDLTEVADTLRGYQLIEHSLDAPLARDTIRLAMDAGVTIYDAVYVALGEILRLPVYAADEVLLRKLPKHAFLRHIKDYRPSEEAKDEKGTSPVAEIEGLVKDTKKTSVELQGEVAANRARRALGRKTKLEKSPRTSSMSE